MTEARWRHWMLPGLMGLIAATVLGAGSLSAGSLAGAPPPAEPRSAACGPSSEPAWYELEERADARGSLVGYDLRTGLAQRVARLDAVLPAEGFAAGPFAGSVLYGSDGGGRSTVTLASPADGCKSVVATSGDIIRRATLDPRNTDLYTFRVDRRGRRDLGVWRQALSGSTPPTRVLPPLKSSPEAWLRFGRTFSTEFTWSTDGATLAVQSCGAFECRTRLLDTATGRISEFDQPGQGELLGVTPDALVSYAACPGTPCPIVAIDRLAGTVRMLAQGAVSATLVNDGGDSTVVLETPAVAGEPSTIRAVALDGTSRSVAVASEPDDRLLPAGSRSLAALESPQGWVVVSRERLTAPGGPSPARLVRLVDGATMQLEGVVR